MVERKIWRRQLYRRIKLLQIALIVLVVILNTGCSKIENYEKLERDVSKFLNKIDLDLQEEKIESFKSSLDEKVRIKFITQLENKKQIYTKNEFLNMIIGGWKITKPLFFKRDIIKIYKIDEDKILVISKIIEKTKLLNGQYLNTSTSEKLIIQINNSKYKIKKLEANTRVF